MCVQTPREFSLRSLCFAPSRLCESFCFKESLAKTQRKTEELGFQREGLWSQRHNRVIARRMASHVIDDSLRRQAVDGRLDFVKAADAAQVVPVGRQGPGTGRSRFLLHDERRLEAGLD